MTCPPDLDRRILWRRGQQWRARRVNSDRRPRRRRRRRCPRLPPAHSMFGLAFGCSPDELANDPVELAAVEAKEYEPLPLSDSDEIHLRLDSLSSEERHRALMAREYVLSSSWQSGEIISRSLALQERGAWDDGTPLGRVHGPSAYLDPYWAVKLSQGEKRVEARPCFGV